MLIEFDGSLLACVSYDDDGNYEGFDEEEERLQGAHFLAAMSKMHVHDKLARQEEKREAKARAGSIVELDEASEELSSSVRETASSNEEKVDPLYDMVATPSRLQGKRIIL